MSKVKFRSTRAMATIGAALLLAGGMAVSTVAQQNRPAQSAGVDNTKMGPYRALAQLTYEEFQKNNYAKSAELARILERTWDQGEEGGSDKNLQKRNPEAFEQIDHAMDVYIKPIMRYAAKAPDAASVEAAYHDFLEKLKQGDGAPAAAIAPGPGSVAAAAPSQSAHLSPEALKAFTGNYQTPPPPDAPAGSPGRTIVISANTDGLVLTMGGGEGDGHPLTPVSANGEFSSQEQPDIHIIFEKNGSGQVTGFSVTNYPALQHATKCAGSC